MINAIVGRPGSGKSYEAVKFHILPAILEDKRLVVTNIPVNRDYIAKSHGQEYADLVVIVDGNFHAYGGKRPFSQVEDFLKFDEWKNGKGQGPLFVIDEIHLPIGRQADLKVLEYLSMHRHYGHDIIAISQTARKMNKDLKDMIEICWRTIKKSAFGEDEGYIRKTHHGVENSRESVQTEERQYDPAFFPYYNSHTKSSKSVIEAIAKDIDTKLNPYKTKSRILIVIGIVSALYFGYSMFTTAMNPVKEPEKQVAEKPPVAQATPEQVAQVTKPATKMEAFKATTKEEIKPTFNEDYEKHLVKRSKQYHPFSKVNLHVEGNYIDNLANQSDVYFSASVNGQRIFNLTLRDFFLAGYKVSVFGDCAVMIQYYEFQEVLTCDVPQISMTATIN